MVAEKESNISRILSLSVEDKAYSVIFNITRNSRTKPCKGIYLRRNSMWEELRRTPQLLATLISLSLSHVRNETKMQRVSQEKRHVPH